MQRLGAFLVRVCLMLVTTLMATGLARLTPVTRAAPLATLTVNRTDDIAPRGTGVTCLVAASTDCTLREAIIKANTDPGSTIIFASSINGTPITLSRAGDDDAAAVGDLDVTASLTISGNGTANTIIQAGTNSTNGIDKVLALNPVCDHAVNVTISGITVRYGRNATPHDSRFQDTGGGIDWCNYGSSTFIFSDSIVSNNTAVTSYGGGLNIDGVEAAPGPGTITISNVTFSNNRTESTTFTANGGGVNIYGANLNITISNSTFTGNMVTKSEGGAIFFQPPRNGSLTIHTSNFTGNSAGSRGGAIAVYLPGTYTQAITIDQGTVISGNTTGTYIGSSAGAAEGGGVYLVSDSSSDSILLSNITVTNNSEYSGSTDKRGGGGIAAGNLGGPTTIVNSRIVGNTASSGSGMHKDLNNGTVTAINNWWGCNAGPGGTGCDTAILGGSGSGSNPTLNFTPWLVLGLSAAPTSLVMGGTSTLTADVTHNSSSGSGYSIPNGTTVTFAATSPDSVSPSTPTTSAGTATSTFTANAVGSRTASATLDNQTVTTTLTVCGNTLTVTNANDAGAGSLRDALANACANGTINFNGNHTLAPASTLMTSKNVTIDGTGHTVSISGTFEFATNAALAGPLTLNNLQIDSGRTITANAGSTLNVTGHWINNGGTFNAGTGTVTFSGSGIHNLTANSATTFNNLTVNSGVILVETVSADNVTVAGTLTNNGTIRKSQAVSSTGLKTFGLAGAYNGGHLSINVVTRGGISNLQVDRIDSNHPNATYGPGNGTSTGRWWNITQTGGSGYAVDLTLPHSVAVPANADVCEYTAGPGYGWDCARTSSTSNTVTRQNVTALSPWAVGDNTGPTAITLTELSGRSSGEASPVAWLVLAAALVMVGMFVSIRYKRRIRA